MLKGLNGDDWSLKFLGYRSFLYQPTFIEMAVLNL